MPWLETCAMTERMDFLVAARAGTETMSELCRRFGISRRTGYKWVGRFAAEGAAGLTDRSRAPHRRPRAVSPSTREALLQLRGEYPTWGPKKLAARLPLVYPGLVAPAPSTIGELLHAAGLVASRRRRRHVPPRTAPLAHATGPNVVWCSDFKGDFALGDQTRCYPLTICDAYSRQLLRCQALPSIATVRVQPLFEASFREHGVPAVIRTDNGPPFASTAPGGLTALSVWWIKLGIRPERIDPGRPEQNGRLERLHGTLKREVCQPPAQTLREQQLRFDHFLHVYNNERPHEALGQLTPAALYLPSPRAFPERPLQLADPDADDTRHVRRNGTIRWLRSEVYVGQALAGEWVALTEIADRSWRVAFGPLLLGHFQHGMSRLLPERPHPKKVLPMSPV